jgi:hypothetical protein
MATFHATIPSRVSQDARFIPQQDSPRSEVAGMFRAALDLAYLQVSVDHDGARCASCLATAAGADELSHSTGCSVGRVLCAWDALKHRVSQKPAACASSSLAHISAA